MAEGRGIAVKLPQEQHDKLRQIAADEDRTVGSLVRRAIREFLDREGNDGSGGEPSAGIPTEGATPEPAEPTPPPA